MCGTSEKLSCNVTAIEPGSRCLEGKEALDNMGMVSSAECENMARACGLDGVVGVGSGRTRRGPEGRKVLLSQMRGRQEAEKR